MREPTTAMPATMWRSLRARRAPECHLFVPLSLNLPVVSMWTTTGGGRREASDVGGSGSAHGLPGCFTVADRVFLVCLPCFVPVCTNCLCGSAASSGSGGRGGRQLKQRGAVAGGRKAPTRAHASGQNGSVNHTHSSLRVPLPCLNGQEQRGSPKQGATRCSAISNRRPQFRGQKGRESTMPERVQSANRGSGQGAMGRRGFVALPWVRSGGAGCKLASRRTPATEAAERETN
jgi:hypothetical protein